MAKKKETKQKDKFGFTEQFHANTVELEGIITKIWKRGEDVFARVATYDEHAEILEPPKNGELPKRQAHYSSLMILGGKTADGNPVSLNTKDKVKVTGYIRDVSYSESLRDFLRKARLVKRIEDDDDDVRVGRTATYVVVESLIRFSK